MPSLSSIFWNALPNFLGSVAATAVVSLIYYFWTHHRPRLLLIIILLFIFVPLTIGSVIGYTQAIRTLPPTSPPPLIAITASRDWQPTGINVQDGDLVTVHVVD